MTLDIQLLGSPKLLHDGTPISLRGHRPLALLAYLLVTDKAHTRMHLTDLLFTASADPRAALRWTLTKLRQAIGSEYVAANRVQVAFNHDAAHNCDVDALLAGHLDVYRGGFLEGLTVAEAPLFEEWQLITGQQLRQVYQDGLLNRIAYHEMRGEHREIVDLAAQLVQMDSLREEWRRLLMRACASLGEWEAAREQYEQCRQLLVEELATTPSQETVDLWHRIRHRQPLEPHVEQASSQSSGTSERDVHGDVARVEGSARPAKLPFFRTSFIGRRAEIDDIQEMLADPDCRLLTVVGPGGIGKTRLAVQAAMNLERRFEQGIFFVPLRPVTGPEAIASAIAGSLELAFNGDESLRVHLLTYVKRKSILLILDNMEHLLAAADWTTGEALLAEILASAPNVRLLVTSRERLHMPEEWVCPLEGLGFPDCAEVSPSGLIGYPAVQLFLQRARQLDPAYHPDRVSVENLHSIVSICQQTAGLPLALEMAATWVHAVPSAAIAGSLDGSLRLLTTPDARRAARHASMHVVFEHSWQLLSTDLQLLLSRLSVFRGRFERNAAVSVADATLFTLSALIDKSLLETARDGRYQLHELLRQFVAEKLAAEPALEFETRDRHSIYFCEFCLRQEQNLKGGDQVEAACHLERALGDLQPAFSWAVDHGKWARVADASFAMGYFCCQYGHTVEGRAIFTDVLNALDASESSAMQALVRARASYWLGKLAEDRGATSLWTQAASFFQLAQRSGLGTDFDEAIIEEAMAITCEIQGDYAGQERHCQASLLSALSAGDTWAEARAYYAFADFLEWRLARFPEAFEHAEEALRLQRADNDRIGMVRTLGTLCTIETFLRNYERALRISEEQLAISLALGNDLRTAAAHRDVSWSLLLSGRFDECVAHLHHARSIYAYYGQDERVAEILYGLTWRNCMGGHYDEARRYAGELQRLLAGKEGYRQTRGVFLYARSQLAFHDRDYSAALEFAQESSEIMAQTGSHNQLALALITLAFANLAHDNLTGAAKQAQMLLGMNTTVGLWGLGVVALVLVRQWPSEESCEQFHELLALQRAAVPMCDSPSYRECVERLQSPEVLELSSKRCARAKTRGRALDPDAVIADLRTRFSVDVGAKV